MQNSADQFASLNTGANGWGMPKSDAKNHEYGQVRTVGKYTFTVAPMTLVNSRQAESKFASMCGSINPEFTPEKFDSERERFSASSGKGKQQNAKLLSILQVKYLADAFKAEAEAGKLDLSEWERMFRPTYAPTYADACRAMGLRKRLWWKEQRFAALENISRLVLDRCDREHARTTMTFQEWYSLFYGFYWPFSPLGFYCHLLQQNLVYTREFVDSAARFLKERYDLLPEDQKKKPILFLGPRVGKFGGLINDTKILPVPVIHTSPKVTENPYLLFIPAEQQKEFKPYPILKMEDEKALEKYEPAIVCMSDMPLGRDTSFEVRKHGSVREYHYFGLVGGMAEGSAWDSWGNPKYRPKNHPSSFAAYHDEGFEVFGISPTSRWMLHRFDSSVQMGFSTHHMFARERFRISKGQWMGIWARRLRPPVF